MKKKTSIYSLLFLLLSALSSCSQWEGETVESAYREPQILPISSNALAAAVLTILNAVCCVIRSTIFTAATSELPTSCMKVQ